MFRAGCRFGLPVLWDGDRLREAQPTGWVIYRVLPVVVQFRGGGVAEAHRAFRMQAAFPDGEVLSVCRIHLAET